MDMDPFRYRSFGNNLARVKENGCYWQGRRHQGGCRKSYQNGHYRSGNSKWKGLSRN